MDGCFSDYVVVTKSAEELRQQMEQLRRSLLEAEQREREDALLVRERQRLDDIARKRGYLNHQDLLDTNARVIGEETGRGFNNHAEFVAWATATRRQHTEMRVAFIA